MKKDIITKNKNIIITAVSILSFRSFAALNWVKVKLSLLMPSLFKLLSKQ